MITQQSLDVPRVLMLTGSAQVSSNQWNILAESWNKRRQIGIGDICWRGFINTLALLRNKNQGLLGPSGDSILFSNAFTASTDRIDEVNPKVPLNQFTFGSQGTIGSNAKLTEEANRLTNYSSSAGVINVFTATDTSPEQIYSQSAVMQGGWDKDTDDTDSPSMFLPRQNNLYYVTKQGKSVYNNWGGVMPTQEIIGQCEDNIIGEDPIKYPNKKIKFTNIKTGTQDTYNGTCGYTINNYYISAYYPNLSTKINKVHVYKKIDTDSNNPAVDTLIKSYNLNEWTYGPYEGSGGEIAKSNIYPLYESLINLYCKDFRGEYSTWYSQSFNFSQSFKSQDFFENQYLLAPHKATAKYVGTTFVSCSRDNVIFNLNAGSHSSESYFNCINTSNTVYPLNNGYTFSKVFVKANKVTGSIDFTLIDSGSYNPTWSFALPVGEYDTNTSGSSIQIIQPAIKYQLNKYSQYPKLAIKLNQDLEIGVGGSLQLFVDELKDYNPDTFDLYWLLRLSSFSNNLYGQDSELEDIYGETYPSDDSKGIDIYNFYRYSGSISPVYGDTSLNNTHLGGNAVFDEFVKGPLSWIRYIKPDDIIGYEYVGGNSSIYLSNNCLSYINPLININDYDDTGLIKTGWKYLVTGSVGSTGSILYNNISYTTNDLFYGKYPVDTISQITGSPTIRLINNIINSGSFATTGSNGDIVYSPAPEQGYSNEWLCLPQQYPWGPSDTSLTYFDSEGEEVSAVNSFADYYLDKHVYNRALAFYSAVEKDLTEIFPQGGLDIQYKESGILTGDLYGNNNQDYADGKQDRLWQPEFPSGWNYYAGTSLSSNLSLNTIDNMLDYGEHFEDIKMLNEYGNEVPDRYKILEAFCKSNILYKPPYKIKEIDTNATLSILGLSGIFTQKPVIKITYEGRWHYHENAPGSILMNNLFNWDFRNDEYRTDENAICDWLIYKYLQYDGVYDTFNHQSTGNPKANKITHKIGEVCANPYIANASFWNRPYASLPTGLIFSKNIPYVYEDFNFIKETKDTRVDVDSIMQLEYDIKNGCEGFISEGLNTNILFNLFKQSPSGNPADIFLYYINGFSNLADYYYQKLLYNTTGKCISIATQNKAKTITAYGLTPQPHCILNINQYNNFAKMVNYLDKARLMIPYQVAISRKYNATTVVPADDVYNRSIQTASYDGSIVNFETTHDPVDQSDWNLQPSSLESNLRTGYIHTILNDQVIAQPNDLGFEASAASYKYRILPQYNYAIPYSVGDLTNRLKITTIDRTDENWIEVYWSLASTGVDCLNGLFNYQKPPNPADNPCSIQDPILGYLHGTEMSSSVMSSYIAPSQMDIKLEGVGKGDTVWCGNVGANSATIYQYSTFRTLYFLRNSLIIQLNLV